MYSWSGALFSSTDPSLILYSNPFCLIAGCFPAGVRLFEFIITVFSIVVSFWFLFWKIVNNTTKLKQINGIVLVNDRTVGISWWTVGFSWWTVFLGSKKVGQKRVIGAIFSPSTNLVLYFGANSWMFLPTGFHRYKTYPGINRFLAITLWPGTSLLYYISDFFA